MLLRAIQSCCLKAGMQWLQAGEHLRPLPPLAMALYVKHQNVNSVTQQLDHQVFLLPGLAAVGLHSKDESQWIPLSEFAHPA